MATIRNLIVRISVTENTDKGIRKVTTSLRETNREIDSADKGSSHFTGTLSKLGRTSLGGLTSGLSKVAQFTKVAAIGLTAVATAAASLNTVSQAGVALAPLLGGLALLPAAAIAGATALGTLKLATSGVGDAFKAAMGSDPKKFAESLKSLSPAAQSVAKELHALRPELIGIRNTAQQNLFKPLTGQLTALVKVLAGPLKRGVADVAIQFGQAGRQVAEFVRQSQSVAVLKQTFAATAGSIHLMLPALQPVLAGFRGLAQVGLSFLPGLAAGASRAAQSFGAWLQQIVASGRAAQWISNALATLKQLFGVVTQVGGILKSVFSAASAAGSNFIGVIGAALGQLNAFLKTAAGKSALQSIFTALATIGQTLGPVIGALVSGLGTLAAPLAQLAQLIGPILTTAVTALAPALAAIAPGLQALFSGLGQAVELVAPALLPLGKAIAQIGVAIGPVLPVVGRLVGQLVAGLAPILGQILVALSPLLVAIVKLAGAFTPLIPPIAQIVLQLVQGLVPVLVALEPVLAQVAGVVGQFLVSALQLLIAAITPLLPVLGKVIAAIGTALLTVLKALAPALLQILQAVLPLLPALVGLLPPLAQILVAVAPLLAILIQIAAAILNLVLPPVVKLATILVSVLGGALKVVVTIISGALKGIVAVFKWLYDVLVGHSIVPDLVTAIFRWFGSLPGRVIGYFKSLATGAVNQVKALLRSLSGIAGQIGGVFKGAGKWLVQAGKNIVIGLWNGVASLWNWLIGKFRSLTNLIPSWKGPPAKDRVLLYGNGQLIMRGLGAGIESQVPALKRTLAGVTGQISTGVSAPVGVKAATGSGVTGRSAGGAVDAKTLAAAVKSALVGVGVHIDGKPVGEIVDRRLGQQTSLRRKTG